MKIYHLNFQWGDYADAEDCYLGGYESAGEREQAIVRYMEAFEAGTIGYPRFDEKDGTFARWESDLNEDVYLSRIKK